MTVPACLTFRDASAFVTETCEVADVPRRAPGMPLFSARLLAIDDCGSLRREGARVGDDVFGEDVRAAGTFGGGEEVFSERALAAS